MPRKRKREENPHDLLLSKRQKIPDERLVPDLQKDGDNGYNPLEAMNSHRSYALSHVQQQALMEASTTHTSSDSQQPYDYVTHLLRFGKSVSNPNWKEIVDRTNMINWDTVIEDIHFITTTIKHSQSYPSDLAMLSSINDSLLDAAPGLNAIYCQSLVYQALGETDIAIEMLDFVISENPYMSEDDRTPELVAANTIFIPNDEYIILTQAYYDRGLLHASKENYEQAISDMFSAITFGYEAKGDCQLLIGQYYLAKQFFDDAYDNFHDAKDNLEPGEYITDYLLALTCYQLRNKYDTLAEAEEHIQFYLQHWPNCTDGLLLQKLIESAIIEIEADNSSSSDGELKGMAVSPEQHGTVSASNHILSSDVMSETSSSSDDVVGSSYSVLSSDDMLGSSSPGSDGSIEGSEPVAMQIGTNCHDPIFTKLKDIKTSAYTANKLTDSTSIEENGEQPEIHHRADLRSC